MKQVFIVGSSSAYGVGAEIAGWGELVKQHLHNKMYCEGGVGEKYEVYNFAKPGATIDFVLENFESWVKKYYRGDYLITIVNVGGNNSKAENEPDNFVSTVDAYTGQMVELLNTLKKHSSHIISVGGGYVDETKTNPKQNPLTGGKSYFSNERRHNFSKKTKELCKEMKIDYVDVGVNLEEWLSKYIYVDGLHPNQTGHELIFNAIKTKLEAVL